MSVSKRYEHTCLHMDSERTIWGMTPQGVAKPVKLRDLEELLRAGDYRVVGLPINYGLITELHALLIRRKAKAQIWIGSPEVCFRKNCQPAPLLSCLSVLEVHDNLHHRWHPLSSETYNNFLLLRALHDEGFSDLTGAIYNSHCLRPFCQFVGLTDSKLAANIIASIGDPRWYLNPKRPYRMTRLESYFGLLRPQLSDVKNDLRQKRRLVLLEALDSLSSDSWLWSEIAVRALQPSDGCRLLLGFLARNWLTQLTPLDHFDPDRFFQQQEIKLSYLNQFKD
jgi:hypothetical protein